MAFRKPKRILFLESLIFSGAEENDLTVFKQIWGDKISNITIFRDKIYLDFEYFNEQKTQKRNIEMLTPVKGMKGQSDHQKQREKAYNNLFSKVRQPIELFFNWLEERTTIQIAQKVRSTFGLLIHAMGKIAIAFIYIIFLMLIRINILFL